MAERTDGPSRVRIKAIQKLGGFCACCAEWRPEFLQIDHSPGRGSGAVDRKLLRRRGDAWLRRIVAGLEGDNLRLLCASCHFAMTQYGYCPHEED